MRKRNALLFLILSICILSGLVSIRKQYDTYPISEGFLNLSEENIDQKVIQLNGPWQFYEGTFKDSSLSSPEKLTVPGTWRGETVNGKRMGKHGFGVFKLRLKLPSPGDYCFKLNYVSSAYELYVNDKQILTNGTIGKDKTTEVPSWNSQFIYFHTDDTDLVIKMKVSNFHCNNGGIVLPIYFGLQAPMFRFHLLNLIKNIAFIGVLIGMACYLSVFNWCLNKKAQSICLWIFCISVLVSASIIDGESLVSVFPLLSIDNVLKIEYVSFMVQITAIQFFIWSMYPDLGKTHLIHHLKLVDLLYTIILIVLPTMPALYDNKVFIPVLFINAVSYFLLIAKAFLMKKPNAGPVLMGYCVYLLCCILQIADIDHNIEVWMFKDFNFYYFGVPFFPSL